MYIVGLPKDLWQCPSQEVGKIYGFSGKHKRSTPSVDQWIEGNKGCMSEVIFQTALEKPTVSHRAHSWGDCNAWSM